MDKLVANRLRTLLTIFILSFFLAMIFYFINGSVLKMPTPMGTIFSNFDDYFADFVGGVVFDQNLEPFKNNFRGFRANYPPGAYFIFLPFTYAFPAGLFAYIFLYIVTILFAITKVLKPYKDKMPLPFYAVVIILGFMNYPSIFSLERSNLESFICVLSIIYIYTVNTRFEKLGLVALSAAASAKIYPILFVIAEKKKAFFKKGLIVTFGILCITAMALYVFNTSWDELMASYAAAKKDFYVMFVIGEFGTHWGSSLSGMIRALVYLFAPDMLDEELKNYIFTYTPFFIAIPFLFTLFLYIKKELELWQKLFFAATFITVWPSISMDYKLIYFFPSLIYYIIAPAFRFERLTTLLFGFLFIPLGFYQIHENVTSSVILHPLIISTIWVLIVRAVLTREIEHKSSNVERKLA